MSEQEISRQETVYTVTEKEGVNHISMPEVSAERMSEICSALKSSLSVDTDVKPTKLTFKKSIDKASGVTSFREAFEIPCPVPSVQGVQEILARGGKGLELLQDAMESIITAQIRDLIADDLNCYAETIDYAKLDWDAIASIPKATRKGGGIPKEQWAAFGESYCSVMPLATGKSADKVAKAAGLLVKKLEPVKTNTPVLEVLMGQIAIFAEQEQAAEFADVIEFLVAKFERLLEKDENLVNAL